MTNTQSPQISPVALLCYWIDTEAEACGMSHAEMFEQIALANADPDYRAQITSDAGVPNDDATWDRAVHLLHFVFDN